MRDAFSKLDIQISKQFNQFDPEILGPQLKSLDEAKQQHDFQEQIRLQMKNNELQKETYQSKRKMNIEIYEQENQNKQLVQYLKPDYQTQKFIKKDHFAEENAHMRQLKKRLDKKQFDQPNRVSISIQQQSSNPLLQLQLMGKDNKLDYDKLAQELITNKSRGLKLSAYQYVDSQQLQFLTRLDDLKKYEESKQQQSQIKISSPTKQNDKSKRKINIKLGASKIDAFHDYASTRISQTSDRNRFASLKQSQSLSNQVFGSTKDTFDSKLLMKQLESNQLLSSHSQQYQQRAVSQAHSQRRTQFNTFSQILIGLNQKLEKSKNLTLHGSINQFQDRQIRTQSTQKKKSQKTGNFKDTDIDQQQYLVDQQLDQVIQKIRDEVSKKHSQSTKQLNLQ